MGDCIDTDAEARCSFGWLVGFQLYRGGQVKKPSLRCIPCHYDNPNPAPDVMAYNSFSRNTSFDGYGGNFSTFIHVALAAHNTHDEQSGMRPYAGHTRAARRTHLPGTRCGLGTHCIVNGGYSFSNPSNGAREQEVVNIRNSLTCSGGISRSTCHSHCTTGESRE